MAPVGSDEERQALIDAHINTHPHNTTSAAHPRRRSGFAVTAALAASLLFAGAYTYTRTTSDAQGRVDEAPGSADEAPSFAAGSKLVTYTDSDVIGVTFANSYTSEQGHPGRLYPTLTYGRVVEPHRDTTLSAYILTSEGAEVDTNDISECEWTLYDNFYVTVNSDVNDVSADTSSSDSGPSDGGGDGPPDNGPGDGGDGPPDNGQDNGPPDNNGAQKAKDAYADQRELFVVSHDDVNVLQKTHKHIKARSSLKSFVQRDNSAEGSSNHITITVRIGAPGSYSGSVTCKGTSGEIYPTYEFDFDGMYVRRELRELSEEDRDDFLFAFNEMYRLAAPVGKAKYGTRFKSLEMFVFEHLTGAADRISDKIHDGLGFLTQHASITAEFEHTLQCIKPHIALPYWDFTIEWTRALKNKDTIANTLQSSELFSDKWFGATHDSGHYIKNGMFEKQTISIVNTSHVLTTPLGQRTQSLPNKVLSSPYGFARAPWNLNPSQFVTRYHKMCGENMDHDIVGFHTPPSSWPSCGVHQSMVLGDNYDSFYDWMWAVPYAPHGPVHTFLGGVGGDTCETNFQGVRQYISEEDTQVMKDNLFILSKNMWRLKYTEYPKYCSQDSTDDCKVQCVQKQHDPKAYFKGIHYLLPSFWESLGVKSVLALDAADKDKVIQLAVCENKFWPGDHLEAASPIEASFWPIHPTLDRLYQFKMMVKPFTDMTWDGEFLCTDNIGCEGHNAYDLTRWTAIVQSDDDSTFERKYHTNLEVREAMNPSSYGLPYIYQHFEWEHCEQLGYSFKTLEQPESHHIAPPAPPADVPADDVDDVEALDSGSDAKGGPGSS